MQEKVYQTHIANIDELKHRLVQVWESWITDCSCWLQLLDSGNVHAWKLKGDIFNNICVQFTR